MKLNRALAAITITVAGAFAAVPAQAVEVGLELVLLIDVSGSVDDTEYGLQKKGYVDAFNSTDLHNAILGSQRGKIAVTYIQWSGLNQQAVKVDWTLIDSVTSAQAFATAINGTSRSFDGTTAIQDAIRFGANRFGTETGGTDNGYLSLRQVIDVSGDGICNAGLCDPPANGRDYATTAGVDAINGLAIGDSSILNYYTNYVKSAGGFAVGVNSFDDFGAAILNKLIAEVAPPSAPEPGTLALLGLGLAGLAAARRRQANK